MRLVRRMRTILALISAIFLSSANASEASPGPRFYGLSAGQVSAFTRSPSGCVLSVLFDNFRTPEAGAAKPSALLRRFAIVSSRETLGRLVEFEIRGALVKATGATIRLKVGERLFTLEPKPQNFHLTARARLSSKSIDTLVEIVLDLPQDSAAAPGDLLLTIDSKDVALPHCSSRGEKG
ncbi:MAG: hypothetical protein ABIT68_08635 [Sphingomicrobium sp.]